VCVCSYCSLRINIWRQNSHLNCWAFGSRFLIIWHFYMCLLTVGPISRKQWMILFDNVTRTQSEKDNAFSTTLLGVPVVETSQLSRKPGTLRFPVDIRHLVYIWQYVYFRLSDALPGANSLHIIDMLFALLKTIGFYLHHVELADQDPASQSIIIIARRH